MIKIMRISEYCEDYMVVEPVPGTSQWKPVINLMTGQTRILTKAQVERVYKGKT